jgi:hypothetical protein
VRPKALHPHVVSCAAVGANLKAFSFTQLQAAWSTV